MDKLFALHAKEEKIVAGIMSGTSVDGIDIAITRIKGNSLNTEVELLGFRNFAYSEPIRKEIFKLFEEKSSCSESICYMNFLLGNIFADALLETLEQYNIPLSSLDLVGSHGQTIYHIPEVRDQFSYKIKSTLQIGEASVIAHKTDAVTISDFRVADMAAMGEGAPLVPYVDYLLYNGTTETIALQNIGGIGNVTVLTPKSDENDLIAFDTGPGNIIIDYVTSEVTQSKHQYDKGGALAAKGNPSVKVIEELLKDPYFALSPPKTTGRELYNGQFCENFIERCKALRVYGNDIIATATAFTAYSIYDSYKNFVPTFPKTLIVSGGGSYNKTLLSLLSNLLPETRVLTQEDIGGNSDAKEAVAFAILANEAICGNRSNVPQVTGASCKKVLGKITL